MKRIDWIWLVIRVVQVVALTIVVYVWMEVA